MNSEDRKKIEKLERRVEDLVKQQESVLLRLGRLLEIISTQHSLPQCTVCKTPMQRVGLGSDSAAEMWECRVCGESQIRH